MEKSVQELERELAELNQHAEMTYSIIIQFCHTLGIVDDDGNMKPEIKAGGGSMMSCLLKAVGGLMADMAAAKSGLGALLNKQSIEQRFAFFSDIEPMLEKYADRYDAKKYIQKNGR